MVRSKLAKLQLEALAWSYRLMISCNFADLHIGSMDDCSDETALRIGNNMTLSGLDRLVCIKTQMIAAFNFFYALIYRSAQLTASLHALLLRALQV